MEITTTVRGWAEKFWNQISQTEATRASVSPADGGETRSEPSRRPAVLTLSIAVLLLSFGLLLVYAARNQNSGSPVGWFLIAVGIFGIMTSIGLFGGYS